MSSQQWTSAIVKAAEAAGIEPAALLAVVEVETSGAPFEADGVTPRFLFERHVFYRELRRLAPALLQRAVDEGLAFSSRRDGQYADQRNSASRQALLAKARAIHPQAANRSCSWGLGQTMGFNAESMGFADVDAMLAYLAAEGVPGQIDLMVRFIERNRLAGFLNSCAWASFAERYNGPAYRKNAYDTKLAAAHARWRAALPHITLETQAVTPAKPAPIQVAPAVPVPPAPERAAPSPAAPAPIGGTPPRAPVTPAAPDPASIQAAEALADLLARILQKAASQAGPQQAAPARPDLVPPDSILHDAELLERLRGRLGSLAGNLGAKGAAASAAAGLPKLDPAALLTPIDKLIGGSTLLGSKSTIAVVGYTLMSVLQSVGVLGTAAGVAATPTGLVLTLLAGGLGGAGLLSKGDRAIKLLGMIAAK